jgi:hypothetical protein
LDNGNKSGIYEMIWNWTKEGDVEHMELKFTDNKSMFLA